MKQSPFNQSLITVLGTLTLTTSLPAAISVLGDYTKSTDGNETFSDVFNGGTQLYNYTSGNVYVVFDLTFTNPTNPGTLDTTSSYGGFAQGGGDLFGQNWEQSTVGVIYYGGRADVAGVTITPGTALKMVVKYELNGPGIDGDTLKFWVNPTLGTGTEGTPDDFDAGRIWNPANASSDGMLFRRGNGSENVLEFADVTIYSEGDSPFAAIPEPSSAALLGLGGIALILRRRK